MKDLEPGKHLYVVYYELPKTQNELPKTQNELPVTQNIIFCRRVREIKKRNFLKLFIKKIY